jgi:hypothetical protein
MSWKSFVTAGLLCVLATPAFAAPTIQMTKGTAGQAPNANNYLDADGNWVWQVRLSQSNPIVDIDDGGPIAAGSPLAAELGLQTTNSAVLGVAVNTTDFDDPNPGNVIFGWEDLTALGGTGPCDSATPGNCPVGLLWDGNDASAPDNQVYTAFGSVDYLSDGDGKDYVRLTTDGPNTGTPLVAGKLNYTVAVTGSYGGGGTNGRIAELNDAYDGDGTPPISLNYDTYANSFVRSVLPGDADLSGDVDGADLSILLNNFFGSTTTQKWFTGNFDNHANGDVDGADLSILLNNFFVAPGPVGPSGGGGGAGGVPEPATMALVALAGLGLIGLRRRS